MAEARAEFDNSARRWTSARFLSLVAVIAGLGLPAIVPEVANIAYLVLAAVGLVMAIVQRRQLPLASLLALCAAGLLIVASLLATGKLTDLVTVAYLVPLYVAAAFALVLDRLSLATIALAAAAGCMAGLGVALYDAVVLGLQGPGASVNNPIHFANIVLTLSFVSFAGFYEERPAIRVLAMLGGLAGLTALWLSDARGPLIALPPMLAMGLFVMAWQRLAGRGRVLLVVTSLVLALGMASLIWWGRILDDLGPFSDAMLLLREGTITDHSTWERVTMYQSAWNALMASPLYGHGLSDLVSKAALFAPQGAELRIYDHLHSDLADFAVGGGLLGLVAYFCLLLSPLFALDWRGRSPAAQGAVFIAATVCLGYFVMGLTNAMFGLLSQTVLFAVVVAVTLCLSRQEAEAR
jgi:O-antigen ligase